MWRDNTKDYTPPLHIENGSSTLRSPVRPGRKHNRKPGGAGSVSSVNGKTPRPGYKQFKPAGGGTGSVARPGFSQGLNRGRNAK